MGVSSLPHLKRHRVVAVVEKRVTRLLLPLPKL